MFRAITFKHGLVVALFLAAGGIASTGEAQTVKKVVKADHSVVLGGRFDIDKGDCTVHPAPEVTLLRRPRLGKVSIDVQKTTPPTCPHVSAGASVVTYKAGETKGLDTVVVRWARPGQQGVTQWFRIDVK